MWQKPAKALLEAHDAVRNFLCFIFFCIFSGGLGFLLRECIDKKADWADKLSLALLTISLSIFCGFHVYGIIAARRQTEGFRFRRFVLCLQLMIYLVSFLVGLYITSRSSDT
jgi:hypothetical protein